MNKAGKVLIVAAHPDDEVLGCGGTIARHVRAGDEIHLILMADGVTSRNFDPDQPVSRKQELARDRAAIAIRSQEMQKAADILGIQRKHIYALGLADQRLDQYSLLSLVKRIEKVKAAVSPKVIYTHFWNDLNLDHRLTAQAVYTAFRPKPGVQNPLIFLFEIPESTYLSVPSGEQAFVPSHFVDITPTLKQKITALQVYESERRIYPDRRSPEFIRELACKRAKGKSYRWAEAFMRLS